MKIAVTGATGNLGRLVIEKLKQKADGSTIVALARSPEKGADLGVEVKKADYDMTETLAPALEGVDTLLLISASEPGKRTAQHKNIIDAAKAAGVKHLVYTSILRADSSKLALADEHKETEELIKASGIDYTLLRNGWYTENYQGSVLGGIEHGAIAGSSGDGKISAAPRADYAEAAVSVLTSDGHENKIYELAGSDSFTISRLADEVSRQSGKQVVFNNMPVAEYAKVLEGVGMPAPVAAVFAGIDDDASRGELEGDDKDFVALIGRPTTPLKDAVAGMING